MNLVTRLDMSSLTSLQLVDASMSKRDPHHLLSMSLEAAFRNSDVDLVSFLQLFTGCMDGRHRLDANMFFTRASALKCHLTRAGAAQHAIRLHRLEAKTIVSFGMQAAQVIFQDLGFQSRHCSHAVQDEENTVLDLFLNGGKPILLVPMCMVHVDLPGWRSGEGYALLARKFNRFMNSCQAVWITILSNIEESGMEVGPGYFGGPGCVYCMISASDIDVL